MEVNIHGTDEVPVQGMPTKSTVILPPFFVDQAVNCSPDHHVFSPGLQPHSYNSFIMCRKTNVLYK